MNSNGLDVVMAPRALERPTLGSLESTKTITPEGRRWFTLATDPFHDDRIDPAGYPDCDVSGSIVQRVMQTIQITRPPSITSGNWDCNIVMWPNPVAQNGILQQEVFPGMYRLPSTSGPFPYNVGGVTALAGPPGTQLYGGSNPDVQDCISGFGCPPAYLNGASRIVGMGFETVNTTNELNVQGSVSSWRQPTPQRQFKHTSMVFNAAGTEFGSLDTYEIRQPPGTLAEAMLLEGTKNWKAKDGSYVVGTMNGLENPIQSPSPLMIVSKTDDPQALVDNPDLVITTPTVSHTVVATEYLGHEPIHLAPYNMGGSYYTGLSFESTIQLTVIYYVERFPTPSETDLVVLADPSPSFDACALELYGQTMAELPVAVKQGDNPLGEWFRDVLNKVTHFTTPILRTLAPLNPIVGGLAVASKSLNRATNTPKQTAKRKAKKKEKRAKKQN